jgi:hypothetical protein
MMAWRRSAARAARLDAGMGGVPFGEADFGGLTEAGFSPRRRLADFEAVSSLGVVRELAIKINMTDQSVIVKRDSPNCFFRRGCGRLCSRPPISARPIPGKTYLRYALCRRMISVVLGLGL